MTLDATDLERLIVAAGYGPSTPVAVGVSSPGTTVLAARGTDGDAVGYAASLAKQVTGACAVLLARDGMLDIDAPIADWLPELAHWAGTIRVRHLVHHTAGLPSTDEVWAQMERSGESDWTSDGVIAALSAIGSLDRHPGAAYAYSSVGYVCLARILERLSGADLGTFARERFFEPLRMRATTLWSGPSPSPPAAARAWPPDSPAPLSIGDGGLWTSVRDLLRWNDALLADTSGLAATLHTPGRLDDGTPLDYAWGVRVVHVDGSRVESHGGSWEGATAKLVRLPDLGVSFAALAADGSVERMTALSASLQDGLLSGRPATARALAPAARPCRGS